MSSLSATATIVAIMGLVVAWCRLPPLSSSSLSSTITATLPTTDQRRLSPVLLPPCHHLTFSALSITIGVILDRHAALTSSGTTRRVPLPPAPPLSKDGTIAPAPSSRPPRCLGLLSGGRRWTFFCFSGHRSRSVRRQRRQHVDVDSCPRRLRRRDSPSSMGLLEGCVDCVFGKFLWSVLWLSFFVGVCRLSFGGARRRSQAAHVTCTKCVQVSLGETCKFLHPSCMKTCNAFALHVFMQLGCTQYEIHEFLREHVQHKSVAQKHATLLRCTCTNLHGTCTELARSLHANL